MMTLIHELGHACLRACGVEDQTPGPHGAETSCEHLYIDYTIAKKLCALATSSLCTIHNDSSSTQQDKNQGLSYSRALCVAAKTEISEWNSEERARRARQCALADNGGLSGDASDCGLETPPLVDTDGDGELDGFDPPTEPFPPCPCCDVICATPFNKGQFLKECCGESE